MLTVMEVILLVFLGPLALVAGVSLATWLYYWVRNPSAPDPSVDPDAQPQRREEP